MVVIMWLVVGALAGWIASIIVGGHGQNALGSIVVGVFGALLGNVSALLLGGAALDGLTPYSLLVATFGAVALFGVIRAIRDS